jgi:putative ABC transport system permease protein
MLNDLRFAARALRRNRAFTLVAVLTLALGIGANTALFSIADAVLLKPLPYAEPERIFRIDEAPLAMSRTSGFTVARALRESPVLSASGIYATGGLNLGGDRGAQRVNAAAVTAGFFGALGSSPLVGRVFTDAEVDANARVAVIGHRLWRSAFAADRALTGKTIELNGRPFVVLAVMPPRYAFPEYADVWIPAGSDTQLTGGAFAPAVIGRLAEGVTPAQALDEIMRIKAERARAAGFTDEDRTTLVPLRDELTGAVRPLLIVVSCAVLLVLLVACINTANLMLARVSAREREIAVRRALGASKARLVRYLLCESALVAGLAAVAAIPPALWTLDLVVSLLPPTLYGVSDVSVDARAAAVMALLSVVATILSAIVPAGWLHSNAAIDALRGGSATSTPFWRRFRMALVAGELAAAVILLAGAATVVRTVATLLAVDLGARGERALTLQLTLPIEKYPNAASAADFYDRLHNRLETAEVEAVGAASSMPGNREIGSALTVRVDGLPASPQRESAHFVKATPGYFRALGIELVAGRLFERSDAVHSPRVAIVSERVPQIYGLAPEAMLGRSFVLDARNRQRATIVGVVRGVRVRGPEVPVGPQIYVPFAQADYITTVYVVVKARGDARALIPSVRTAVASVDPSLPPYNVRTFDEVRASYLADRRFAMTVMVLFAGLAIALSVIGLYGVMAYLTQLRTREIGIRMALGATSARLVGQTLRVGLLGAAAGVLMGTAAAAALSRVFISKVPGVQAIDAWTLALTAAAVLIIAAGTAWLPARRAASVDPIEALRTTG